ncbi:MAG TPA: hypothetical protein DDX98_03210 [Bacteroidales bacterium]|jgi:DNA-binding NtrC family response regulator|nr:hypothetical protein [Bacteroidales bacterium]
MSRKVQPLIYIVDKNRSYRNVIISCLKALKLTNIKTFDDGEQCYASSQRSADLIILDYNLGKENWTGIEFMEEYSRLHSNTSFLFLSSFTGIETAVKAIRKGALDYILKSKTGLVRLVKQLEGYKQFHTKSRREKLMRLTLMGLIITLTTLTTFMSFYYLNHS